MEKYDRFIMFVAVYSRVCFTYIIMVYVDRDVARITAIARLIIILYYTPGGGVDCRRHGGRLRLVAIVEEIEKQCSVENGRPHFRRLQTNTPDFDWSYSKAAGLYSALYTERSLVAVGQFDCKYIFIILHTVKPLLMDTCKMSTHYLQ